MAAAAAAPGERQDQGRGQGQRGQGGGGASAAAAAAAAGIDVDDLPEEFVCPITHQLMTDPVIAVDGHSYERSAIQKWLDLGNATSPMTNERLERPDLVQNHALRSQIQRAVEQAAAAAAKGKGEPGAETADAKREAKDGGSSK